MKMTMNPKSGALALAVALSTATSSEVQASVFYLTVADFGPPQVTFSEVPERTRINGLTINGFTFSETVPNATVKSDEGPGDTTNNITQPSALSEGMPRGQITTISLPGLQSAFGFGFALFEFAYDPQAVTITLFNGMTSFGALVFDASPDPFYPGGFAGIGSTLPFDSVQIVFNPEAGGYDFDNIRVNAAVNAIPEPSSLPLLGIALGGLAFSRSFRSKRK